MDEIEAQVGKMEAQMQQWGAKLDELVAKAEELGAEAKADYRKGIDEFSAKHQKAQTRFSQLAEEGFDKWETLKAGIEKAYGELELAFKKVTAS